MSLEDRAREWLTDGRGASVPGDVVSLTALLTAVRDECAKAADQCKCKSPACSTPDVAAAIRERVK